MKIILKWVNRNPDEEGTYIYRSTNPIDDPSKLPTPIATVGPGITEYIDENIVRGNRYYYRLGVFRNGMVAISEQIITEALRRTGPGPQQLKVGDGELGYYGITFGSELFDPAELSALVGLTAGELASTTADWMKFAYKGKVLFIPRFPIRRAVTWNDIYNAGCVYGTNDFGIYPNTPGVNQYKVITRKGERFLVRLIRGGVADPSPEVSSATVLDLPYNGSEWDDLMHRIAAAIPAAQRGGNWEEFSTAQLTAGSSSGSWVMETSVISEQGAILRGLGSNNHKLVTSGGRMIAKSTFNDFYNWRPCLEYIPND